MIIMIVQIKKVIVMMRSEVLVFVLTRVNM